VASKVDDPRRQYSGRRRISPGARDVVWLAVDFAKGTQWPGGAVGALGAVLIAGAVVFEEINNQLTSAEFVATLAVGALLSLAGPLVIVYTNTAARRAAVQVEVADKQALTAEAEAKAEAERAKAEAEKHKRVEVELRLEELRLEKSPSTAHGR
jgi:hypothetical protein